MDFELWAVIGLDLNEKSCGPLWALTDMSPTIKWNTAISVGLVYFL